MFCYGRHFYSPASSTLFPLVSETLFSHRLSPSLSVTSQTPCLMMSYDYNSPLSIPTMLSFYWSAWQATIPSLPFLLCTFYVSAIFLAKEESPVRMSDVAHAYSRSEPSREGSHANQASLGMISCAIDYIGRHSTTRLYVVLGEPVKEKQTLPSLGPRKKSFLRTCQNPLRHAPARWMASSLQSQWSQRLWLIQRKNGEPFRPWLDFALYPKANGLGTQLLAVSSACSVAVWGPSRSFCFRAHTMHNDFFFVSSFAMQLMLAPSSG